MANFNNSEIATALNVVVDPPGRVDAAFAHPLYGVPKIVLNDPRAYSTDLPTPLGFNDDGQKKPVVPQTYDNAEEVVGLGVDWFEHFHVLPREVVLGNVLSNQQIPFEVYSAFRRDDHDWDSFVNNAGAGVTMLNLPPLPYKFKPQDSGGLNLVLEVSTSGDPKVDTTLDFIFDVPSTILVPITLERVVLFPLPPEMPYVEDLEFLTDVMVHKDGTEQRISLRKNPRQFFTWDFILTDGVERSRIHNFLFDWQSRVFGVPMWHELTRLSVAASINDTTVTVQTTADADYRTDDEAGNLVLIYESPTKFDVLPLNALTATDLTFDSGLLNDYAVGTQVMPLRTGVLGERLGGSRFVSADAKLKLRFRILDNDANLADTSAWNMFNGKVLVDDCNAVRGNFSEAFEKKLVVIDGDTGVTEENSPWTVNRRVTRKTFLGIGQSGLWTVRQLLHALRGQQISWYLPSFSDDLIPFDTLDFGSNQLDIVNVGYSRFVQERQGRNVIRVTLNNGDPPVLRTIVSSTETSLTEEQLVLDDTWPATYTVDEVDRIEYVEEVRFDADTIRITHEKGDRLSVITAPVVAVLE